jgi:hypothetical protein
MSTVTRPRGPLPARVYWTRRLLVLVLALGLVLAVARLLGGGIGGNGDPGTPSARPVGAEASTTPAVPTATTSASADRTAPTRKRDKDRKPRKTKTPLAVPTGPCPDEDVMVVPGAPEAAHAGSPVVLPLELRTQKSSACTWDVSARSLAVKLTSGDDRIWTTQDCPGAVPRQSVVVRSAQPTTIHVTWNGQRSDRECSRTTPWALPGYYHVQAAALGAEPAEAQFELADAVRATITPKPKPANRKPDGKRSEKPR